MYYKGWDRTLSTFFCFSPDFSQKSRPRPAGAPATARSPTFQFYKTVL